MVDTVIGTEDAQRADIPQMERVLLAASGSFAGLAAARWLIARARTHVLSVQVSVAPDAVPGVDDEGPDPAAAARRVQEYLRLVEPRIESDVVLLSAERETDVLDATLETDLLVLTTTVRDPEAEVHPGSFASRVALQAGCSTVIVPRAWTPNDGPIVVGVGDGVGEYAALDRAAAEAQQQERCLVLLRASRLSPAVDRSVAGDLDVEFADTLDRQSLEDATTYVVERYPAVSVRSVLTALPPEDALMEQGRDAALVVVGSATSVGTGGGADIVARSVAEHPPCPVMIVPPAPHGQG